MTGKQRRPLVAGNWKLHLTLHDAKTLALALKAGLAGARNTEVAVAPVFTGIHTVASALEGSGIRTYAQDVYWENQGAFTGEVSAPFLKDAGAAGAIVGHSERRALFGETDADVQRKTRALLDHGLSAIVCVGESLEDREGGRTLDVVLGQLGKSLDGFGKADFASIVVAYEPVWAIGTGRTASPGDAQEVHGAIRGRLRETFDTSVADGTRILYGGSVKPNNAAELMAQPDIDGALVGGASLTAESFVAIVAAAG